MMLSDNVAPLHMLRQGVNLLMYVLIKYVTEVLSAQAATTAR